MENHVLLSMQKVNMDSNNFQGLTNLVHACTRVHSNHKVYEKTCS